MAEKAHCCPLQGSDGGDSDVSNESFLTRVVLICLFWSKAEVVGDTLLGS